MPPARTVIREPQQDTPPEPLRLQEVLERFVASKDSSNAREIHWRVAEDLFERLGVTDVSALEGDDTIRYKRELANTELEGDELAVAITLTANAGAFRSHVLLDGISPQVLTRAPFRHTFHFYPWAPAASILRSC